MKDDTNTTSRPGSSSKLDKDDLILFFVIAISIALGIFFPSFGIIFEPFLLVSLGLLLFLSLLKMNLRQLLSQFRRPIPLIIFTILKLLVIPLLLFLITSRIYPSLALPVLLLSGISTGLGAPFVINIIERSNRLPFVVGSVIVTSITVPFVLPSFVYLLIDFREFNLPFVEMVFLLASALLLPLTAGWVIKQNFPTWTKKIETHSSVPSLVMISVINLGIFAKYSDHFFAQSSFVVAMFSAAFVLFFVYGFIGYLAGYFLDKNDKSFRVAAFVSMSYVNNILVVVFAAKFFGDEIAALAAFYNFAYYGMMIPIKWLFLGGKS
ncbi:MAG TPA: bile acid:sodium symporter [Candidatus Nitrosocosmicus sp.]|nr:bile acid:sodium symporter [Candidatus Nitrosocosmicus sp.]